VTRLFDALRKARTGDADRPAAPPLAPVFAVSEARTARPMPDLPHAPVEAARRSIVPLPAAAAPAPDVLREMTGLRVRLEAILNERIPRVVMFLAAQGGEGTSSVTLQFARALAADQRLRILLVDVHARRPEYTTDGRPRGGRVGLLPRAGSGNLPHEPNLDLMPVPGALAAAGGSAPQVLQAILQSVAGGYDWMLLDGPPVVESPDAAPLAQAADGVVMVVQAGRTKRPVLVRAVDLVNRSGGHVVGMVLNRRRLEIPGFIYRRI
jgi:Mrp family chromosome partitioning ATPase